MTETGVAGLATERLEAEICDIVCRQDRLQYRMLQLVAECDRRSAWISWGATSCAQWLADRCELELCTAREHVRVARALERLPLIDAAFGEGRLSYTKVRILTRVAGPEDESELVELAGRVPAGDLAQVLAARQAEQLTPEELAAAQLEMRQLSWRTDVDGMVQFFGRATPLQATFICSAIDARVMASNAPAGASLGHQRMDALADICSESGGKGVRAEAIVHVHVLPDGTPMMSVELDEFFFGASLRALVHDCEGNPIDASPARRFATRRQDRFVRARDKHCQRWGCRSRAFLDVHHIVHWADGSPTVVSNLILMCAFHHRLLHRSERPT